jgi:S-DNA-T family DNA segregation ATPase FtsK/SpoIIIE
MASGTEKKKDPAEAALIGIGKGIARFLKSVFYGIKKLNRAGAWIGLLLFIAVAATAYTRRELVFELDIPVYAQWIVYGAALASPLFYLAVIGAFRSKAAGEYDAMFEEISFRGKDKTVPRLIYKKEDGKKEILVFKSNIPLAAWEKAKPQLETGFDASILKMEHNDSKKQVKLTTVGSGHKLSEDILWDDKYISGKDGVVVVGENILTPISFDLNRTPHVLAAGETGSGKSVTLRCMFYQFVQKGGLPFMLDFKGGVEFGIEYEKFGEVVTERKPAIELMGLLVKENAARLEMFRNMRVKNLKEYNSRCIEEEQLSRIGVFCDEIGEMLDKKGLSGEEKEQVETLSGYLSTLARLSRATGINLFLGVQRPDANVLTGQIKNNVPVRISGRFADKSASEIVLGNSDACRLPGVKGRFLFKVGADTIEFQAYNFNDAVIDNFNAEDLTDGHRVLVPELAARLERLKKGQKPDTKRQTEHKAPGRPEARKPARQPTPAAPIKKEVRSNLNFDYGKEVNKPDANKDKARAQAAKAHKA